MRRYVIKARFSEQLDEECPDIGQAFTVFEPEPSPRRTGLIDKDGNDIMCIDAMDQIGFVRR